MFSAVLHLSLDCFILGLNGDDVFLVYLVRILCFSYDALTSPQKGETAVRVCFLVLSAGRDRYGLASRGCCVVENCSALGLKFIYIFLVAGFVYSVCYLIYTSGRGWSVPGFKILKTSPRSGGLF